jgi:hypothetical protein
MKKSLLAAIIRSNAKGCGPSLQDGGDTLWRSVGALSSCLRPSALLITQGG